jgi:hypothetical protein
VAATSGPTGRLGALPFAFIVDGQEERSSTLLWMGPLAEVYDSDPLQKFNEALSSILSGTYDLEAAQDVVRQEERSYHIFVEIHEASRLSDYSRILVLLDELSRLRLHRNLVRTVATNMSGFAWSLAEKRPVSPEALQTARRALTIGERFGGSRNAEFLDTKARIAHLEGNLDEAITLQRRALTLASDPMTMDELVQTLNSYLAEAGFPPVEQKPNPEESAATAPWSGVINDAMSLLQKPGSVACRSEPDFRQKWAPVARKM